MFITFLILYDFFFSRSENVYFLQFGDVETWGWRFSDFLRDSIEIVRGSDVINQDPSFYKTDPSLCFSNFTGHSLVSDWVGWWKAGMACWRAVDGVMKTPHTDE